MSIKDRHKNGNAFSIFGFKGREHKLKYKLCESVQSYRVLCV